MPQGSVDSDVIDLLGTARPDLNDAFLQAPVAYRNTQRHPDELPIGKHDAGSRIAIIEYNIDAGSLQTLVEFVGGVANRFTLVIAHGADHYFERGDRTGPNDAACVVVLFDGGCGNAAHPYAVAPHLHDGRLSVGFQEGRIQRTGILVAQEENMPHFDAALNTQRAALWVG